MEGRHRIAVLAVTALAFAAASGAEELSPVEANTKAPKAPPADWLAGAAEPGALNRDPTLGSPRGFAGQRLEAYDDFLHRSIASKRIEILRFVDRDDRRVFLGITRDGYLGIHVQKRDR